MQTFKLEQMIKGWVVGDFAPTCLKTDAVEFAVKHYQAGDSEAWHFHKIATEVTVVVSGEVEMNNVRYSAGDVIVMEPHDGTDFRALTAATTAVVKVPGAKNDKYLEGQ
jgi:quercetin dioxygenase-like cupin family protein